MTITTPKHRATLWIAANFAVVALIPAAISYYSRELNAGAYPVDADSIGIPIMETGISALTLLLPLNIACLLLLRRYAGKSALWTSTKGLRLGQHVIAGLCLVVGIMCLAGVVESLREGAPEFSIVLLMWCYLAVAMRAAFVASARNNLPEVKPTSL
ncbi:MAG TPA: hypothetical protein VGR97_03180 [Candidatus Acidoferrales bacterium]|nr:hypothetical protein [Candidatus Acidoferrales bacterium]